MDILDTQLGIDKLILIGVGSLFIIEQIIYRFLGSYPYRFGILLKTLSISGLSIFNQSKKRKPIDRLAIKRNDKKKETYVRYKYPFAVIGPLLFVGQIKDNENKVMIRIGPVSAIFILSLFAVSISFDGFYGFLNVLILIALIVWFYIRFYNAIQIAGLGS